jgi:hypothetical protein
MQHAIVAAPLPVSRRLAAVSGTSPPMVLVASQPDVPPRWWHRPAVVLSDLGLGLVIGALLPFAILIVGTPVALVVRALIELMNRF